ncbi:DoxX family protein [Kitasatospora sp. NPDC056138]|uniref:DoxX family protein n=1 Tax=Kitasatospora sp. NPDC056138 TaxID=3345724 RepID=UPI0035DF64DE
MSFAPHALAGRAGPHLPALFRAVVALLFTCHGAASLFGVLGGAHGGRALPAGQWPGWWAALIQLVGGMLVLLGLGTRTAALLCSGSMAYAYFSVHQGHALWPIQNGGEPAVLFCRAFLAIAVTGPGGLAVDRPRPQLPGRGLKVAAPVD